MNACFPNYLSLMNSFKQQIAIQSFQHKPHVPTLISNACNIIRVIDELACLSQGGKYTPEILNGQDANAASWNENVAPQKLSDFHSG